MNSSIFHCRYNQIMSRGSSQMFLIMFKFTCVDEFKVHTLKTSNYLQIIHHPCICRWNLNVGQGGFACFHEILYKLCLIRVYKQVGKQWRTISQHRDAITKTYLYNFDPLKPHLYIVKLGFTGVYIIFLISAQNIDCGYSLEPPRRGGSNKYPQSLFWAEIWKISEFFIWKFSVFGEEIFYIFE